jgi:protein-L-isoaspartate O-methyltransferase
MHKIIHIGFLSELYEKARAKLKQAEIDSDLQTDMDDGNNGRPIRNKR